MLRIFRIPALALTLALPTMLFAAAPRPRQTTPAAHVRLAKPGAAKHAAAPPAYISATPRPGMQPSVQPLRPSQMPAVPPRVSFQNGLLTIVAPNSTLAEIVAAVHNATGIQIEGAPSGQRVAAKIGPAPVRSVLLSLFDGSKFDYVILGSATDPQQVQHVILTPQLGGGTVANNNPAPPPPQPEQDVPEDNSDQNADYVAPPDEQPQPQQPPQQMQPVPAAQQTNPWGAPNPDANPDQQVKTPQQLMEELRQQQLQQEQNNANNPNPNPRQEQPIPH